MPRTYNRLSTRSALLTRDPSTSANLPLAERRYDGIGWVANLDEISLIFSPPPFVPFSEGDRFLVSGIGSPDYVDGSLPSEYSSLLNNGERVVDSYTVVSPPASASATSSASAIIIYTGSNTTSSSAVYAYGFSSPGASVSATRLYNYEWEATSNDGEVVTRIISSDQVVDSRYVLEFSPPNSSPVTISLSGVQLLAADNDANFSFNAKIKTPSTCTISTTLSIDDSVETFTPVETIIYSGEYSSIRSNLALLPSTDQRYSVSISIVVSGHNGNVFFMTLPHLINDDLFYSNPFVNLARFNMPDFYYEIDSQQENPSNPMHRLIDCLSASANEVWNEYSRIFPYETNELLILQESSLDYTKSTMVDPTIADKKYIPWLSQFNGSRAIKNFKKQNGENYFPSEGAELAFARWQLLTGYYGKNAGTREALVETAKKFLEFTDDASESTRSVAVSRHYEGNEFQIRVLTLVNETPDVTESGQSSQTMLDALEEARPLGYKIVHSAVDEFEFTIGDDDLGILGTLPPGTSEDGFQNPEPLP